LPRFTINRSVYSIFSIMIITGWPFFLLFFSILDEQISLVWPIQHLISIGIVNIIIFVIVYKQSSSPYLSFNEGLALVAIKYSSGCANLTLLYMPIFHIILYLIMILVTFIGFFRGSDSTKRFWSNLIFELTA
jgi:hypothetical protein